MMSDFQDGKCLIVDDVEVNIRKLRYRLKRQGMLELDVWLSRLEPALEDGNADVRGAIMRMMECEIPELVAMMHGERSVSSELRSWLEHKHRF